MLRGISHWMDGRHRAATHAIRASNAPAGELGGNMDKTHEICAAICAQVRVPFVLVGPPGSGKTTFLGLLTKRAQLGRMEALALAQYDPTDVMGCAYPQDGVLERLKPGWLARLQKDGRGVFFADELSCAAPSVQAVVLRLFSERDGL